MPTPTCVPRSRPSLPRILNRVWTNCCPGRSPRPAPRPEAGEPAKAFQQKLQISLHTSPALAASAIPPSSRSTNGAQPPLTFDRQKNSFVQYYGGTSLDARDRKSVGQER